MPCIMCSALHRTDHQGRPGRSKRLCSRACLQHAIAELGRNGDKLHRLSRDDGTADRRDGLTVRNRQLTDAIISWRPHHG